VPTTTAEGGTLALMALAQRAVTRGASAIVLLGSSAARCFMRCGSLRRHCPVLSAIEGISSSPRHSMRMWCADVIILVVLSGSVARHGEGPAFFGPVMWSGSPLLRSRDSPIMRHPKFCLPLNPLYAVSFMIHHGVSAL